MSDPEILAVLKPREVIATLNARRFVEVCQRGSHKQFRHPDGRTTTVPFLAGRDISPILLRQICAQQFVNRAVRTRMPVDVGRAG